jgi:hypothetical protein
MDGAKLWLNAGFSDLGSIYKSVFHGIELLDCPEVIVTRIMNQLITELSEEGKLLGLIVSLTKEQDQHMPRRKETFRGAHRLSIQHIEGKVLNMVIVLNSRKNSLPGYLSLDLFTPWADWGSNDSTYCPLKMGGSRLYDEDFYQGFKWAIYQGLHELVLMEQVELCRATEHFKSRQSQIEARAQQGWQSC